MTQPRRPSVAVIGLGGTIAMDAHDTAGATPSLSAADLIDAVPDLGKVDVDLEVEDFRSLPGASLRFDDLYALADRIHQRLDQGTDGIVVTQGTDTIEETAFVLDLLHPASPPVVVTGAMRNPTMAGADGPANLLAAVQVAASPKAQGLGALVVFADEIHAARRVRKTHATNLMAFESPEGGPVGYVVEGDSRIVNTPTGRFCVPRAAQPAGPGSPRVGLAVLALDDDGAFLDLANQYDGLVIAGFGVGHVPAWLVERLGDLAARIPVLLASRTGAGTALRSTYGFVGSESSLLSAGLLSAGSLDPYKARVLLHVLLAATADRHQIAAAIAAAGGHAPPTTWPWEPPTIDPTAENRDA